LLTARQKGGLTQLSKVLAIEWAPYHVNVNCIAPTFVLTPMTEPTFKEKEFNEEVMRRIPLRKLAATEDVANAAVYLASDASDMIIGATVLVDGGWVAW
ncbi:MAG: SDR family NAD(P)-dependent oxidoreductase, partial [Bacillota bacterium]